MNAQAADQRETRGERKERTRRAILDAALELSSEGTFAALSLRAVAKEVGIVPTAFYRHFESIDALGLALVEECFVSLRAILRDVRRNGPALDDIIDGSLRVLVEHVHESWRPAPVLHVGPTGFTHGGQIEAVALGEEVDLVGGQWVRFRGRRARDALAVVERVAAVLMLNR